eukprot:1156794-Pelagomonas_calceolata.AAC.3
MHELKHYHKHHRKQTSAKHIPWLQKAQRDQVKQRAITQALSQASQEADLSKAHPLAAKSTA